MATAGASTSKTSVYPTLKIDMATASISKTSVNTSSKITECSICLCTFTKPKSLPCIHTFCSHCLVAYAKSEKPGNQMPCPMCRQPFTIPKAGITAIPNNQFIEHILEMEAIVDKKAQSQVVECDLCGDDEEKGASASCHCVECGQNLCPKCSGLHKKQQFGKNHNIVIFEDTRASQSIAKLHISYCTTHKDEQLKLFCYNCKQTVCLMCFAVSHNGHKCSDINASAEEFKKQLSEDNEKMKIVLSATEKELDALENDKSKHLEQIVAAQNTIAKQCRNLKSLIDSKQKQMELELNNLKDTRLTHIETRKVDLSSKLVTMQSLVRYSEELMQKGSVCDISRAANDLVVRSEQLLKDQVGFISKKLLPYEMQFAPAKIASNSITVGAILLNGEPADSTKKNASDTPQQSNMRGMQSNYAQSPRNSSQWFMSGVNCSSAQMDQYCQYGCRNGMQQVSLEVPSNVSGCSHGYKRGNCPYDCKIENKRCAHGCLLK